MPPMGLAAAGGEPTLHGSVWRDRGDRRDRSDRHEREADEMERVVIALGSNLGDSATTVVAGWNSVCAAIDLRGAHLSRVYRSRPAEAAVGSDFANAVGIGDTARSARDVLRELHAVERDFGRDRQGEGFHGSRTLDLDLIDWGGAVIDEPGLEVPHPRLAWRDFVLVPLAELLPAWRHPISDLTVSDLIKGLKDDQRALR